MEDFLRKSEEDTRLNEELIFPVIRAAENEIIAEAFRDHLYECIVDETFATILPDITRECICDYRRDFAEEAALRDKALVSF